MNKYILYIAIATVFTLLSCAAPNEKSVETEVATDDTIEIVEELAFDSVRAQKCGADDYGMKKYVMAFLKKGANRDLDAERSAQLQRAHLDNITRMAEEGKLVLAGPFFGDGDLRGIYIFNVSSIEEAEALTNSDPAIQEGSLVMELKEWYGSAALMEVNDIHGKIAKINI